MAQRAIRIKEKLQIDFSPSYLDVINESSQHSGHRGDDGSGESHFRIKITSDIFVNLSRVASHRLITTSLSDEFASGLHALSIEILQ